MARVLQMPGSTSVAEMEARALTQQGTSQTRCSLLTAVLGKSKKNVFASQRPQEVERQQAKGRGHFKYGANVRIEVFFAADLNTKSCKSRHD